MYLESILLIITLVIVWLIYSTITSVTSDDIGNAIDNVSNKAVELRSNGYIDMPADEIKRMCRDDKGNVVPPRVTIDEDGFPNLVCDYFYNMDQNRTKVPPTHETLNQTSRGTTGVFGTAAGPIRGRHPMRECLKKDSCGWGAFAQDTLIPDAIGVPDLGVKSGYRLKDGKYVTFKDLDGSSMGSYFNTTFVPNAKNCEDLCDSQFTNEDGKNIDGCYGYVYSPDKKCNIYRNYDTPDESLKMIRNPVSL